MSYLLNLWKKEVFVCLIGRVVMKKWVYKQLWYAFCVQLFTYFLFCSWGRSIIIGPMLWMSEYSVSHLFKLYPFQQWITHIYFNLKFTSNHLKNKIDVQINTLHTLREASSVGEKAIFYFLFPITFSTGIK